MYFAIVYYSWVLAAVVWAVVAVTTGHRRGWVLIVVGGAVQMIAHGIHLNEWRRLAGQPDRLYVWIAPLLFALVGFAIWIAGLVRQWRTAGSGGRSMGDD